MENIIHLNTVKPINKITGTIIKIDFSHPTTKTEDSFYIVYFKDLHSVLKSLVLPLNSTASKLLLFKLLLINIDNPITIKCNSDRTNILLYQDDVQIKLSPYISKPYLVNTFNLSYDEWYIFLQDIILYLHKKYKITI